MSRKRVKVKSGTFGRFFSKYDKTGQAPEFNDPKIQRGMDLAKKWRKESYDPVD